MPIYTKKGDKGETGLFNGKRVPKDNALIEAIGAVDELNAMVGIARDEIKDNRYKIQDRKKENGKWKMEIETQLENIQNDLFGIGAQLAGYNTKGLGVSSSRIKGQGLEKRTIEMEKEIDKMWSEMPPLKNFILPSGQIHLARTVCRRAERRVVAVSSKQLAVSIKYLNRLSDYLFCLARWVNFTNGVKEKIWENN